MNTLKIASLIFIATTTVGLAQEIEPVKKAIDAEKFENAKVQLKAILAAKPTNGKAAFLLGTVYLKQNIEDSAKIFFNKGLDSYYPSIATDRIVCVSWHNDIIF